MNTVEAFVASGKVGWLISQDQAERLLPFLTPDVLLVVRAMPGLNGEYWLQHYLLNRTKIKSVKVIDNGKEEE